MSANALKSPWRSARSPCMTSDTFALAAYSAATPIRSRAAAPTRADAEEKESKLRKLPANLRGYGGHFAILCAALAGIVPFFGVAVFSLMGDTDGEEATAAPLPQPAPMQQPLQLAPVQLQPFQVAQQVGFDASGGMEMRLQGALDSLQRAFQQQESGRAASDAALISRLRRVEDGLAAERASALSHGGTRSLAALGSSEDVEDRTIASLGVDWAAWTAGAEIDHSFTSWGLGREPSPSGILGRAGRAISAALPRYRAYVGHVSPPPEVVLAADSAPPSRCFALEASNGSLAVTLPQPRRVRHVSLERLPAWAALQPQASPRHFEVFAWTGDSGSAPYSSAAGSFEYLLDGPRFQAFALPDGLGALRALLFKFGENWGAEFTAVCRVRFLGPGMDE